MANNEPTTVPTAEEVEEARRIVADADARVAAENAAALEARNAPLVALLAAAEAVRQMLPQMLRDFSSDRSVTLHLNAVDTGLDGLVQMTGYAPEEA